MESCLVELASLTPDERIALVRNAASAWPELVEYLVAVGFVREPKRRMFANHYVSIDPKWLQRRPTLRLVKKA